MTFAYTSASGSGSETGTAADTSLSGGANGCELGGGYGLRVKNFDTSHPMQGLTISGNNVTADATYCEARALDFTNAFPGGTAGTVSNNTFKTTGSVGFSSDVKFNSYNNASYVFTNNTFGNAQYCVEIGNDGDVGSGANATVQSGQTWTGCGTTKSIIDTDLNSTTTPKINPQQLVITDTAPPFPNPPTWTCFSFSSAANLYVGGVLIHTCP